MTGNHPNPFNPSTTISFVLPSSGKASLAVYDVTGRKVRELAVGTMTAGAHSAVWDGRDASGRAVSSGVYFARLSLDGAAVTHRMTLMKWMLAHFRGLKKGRSKGAPPFMKASLDPSDAGMRRWNMEGRLPAGEPSRRGIRR